MRFTGLSRWWKSCARALTPTHLVVVWDGGLSAERMAALPEYKANGRRCRRIYGRNWTRLPPDLAAAGLAGYCAEGVEADDYIACVARRASAAGWNVVIASSDKDFMQLVSPQDRVMEPERQGRAVWTREQVVAKTGVEPGQVADWLALMGDAVDNIPGVPGVGTKTAAELLRQFGSVAGVLADWDGEVGQAAGRPARGPWRPWSEI